MKFEYMVPIINLGQELEKREIPFSCVPSWDGLQLYFPWHDGDIVCNHSSYGHEKRHVESYCFPWDNGDCTELTVEEAVELLTDCYKKYKRGE